MEKIPQPPALDGDKYPERLRAWRESIGWTRVRLARVLGISDRQIRRWESGEQRPVGVAAQSYQRFRDGSIVEDLHQQAIELERRIRELRGLVIDTVLIVSE